MNIEYWRKWKRKGYKRKLVISGGSTLMSSEAIIPGRCWSQFVTGSFSSSDDGFSILMWRWSGSGYLDLYHSSKSFNCLAANWCKSYPTMKRKRGSVQIRSRDAIQNPISDLFSNFLLGTASLDKKKTADTSRMMPILRERLIFIPVDSKMQYSDPIEPLF